MPGLVGRPERAAPLQFGHQFPGDRLEVVGDGAGPQPEAGQAGLPPVDQQVGQLRGRAGEDGRVARVGAARELVQARLALGRRGRARAEEDDQVGEDAAPGRPAACAASDLGHDPAGVHRRRPASRSRRRPTSRSAGTARVACPRADTIGCPCGGRGRDRRALDAEVVAREVDVVQLVAVDEPAGRGVADLGVVLPAVPQPPDDLDVVGRLVEQRRRQLPRGRIVAVCSGPGRERRAGRRGRPPAGWPRPGPGPRPGRCSRSRAWRWPSRCGTARCA